MTREEAIDRLKEARAGHKEFLSIEAIDMAIKALDQEPCKDVTDINNGDLYMCSCGYGWDKSKVVRHHFCPNCGAKVAEGSEE